MASEAGLGRGTHGRISGGEREGEKGPSPRHRQTDDLKGTQRCDAGIAERAAGVEALPVSFSQPCSPIFKIVRATFENPPKRLRGGGGPNFLPADCGALSPPHDCADWCCVHALCVCVSCIPRTSVLPVAHSLTPSRFPDTRRAQVSLLPARFERGGRRRRLSILLPLNLAGGQHKRRGGAAAAA